MNKVYCFSGGGHSRAVAEFLARALDSDLIEITNSTPAPAGEAKTAVIVFPIYCQNIPTPIIPFLKALRTKNAALVATYGGISHGNVLFEAARMIRPTVTASTYIETGHTYLGEPAEFDPSTLYEVIEKIKLEQPGEVKRAPKNIFADLFPAWRSRIGVKITRFDTCTACGRCAERCPMGAIENGIPNGKCIRCLRCVSECPNHALEFAPSRIMKIYLSKHRKEKK